MIWEVKNNSKALGQLNAAECAANIAHTNSGTTLKEGSQNGQVRYASTSEARKAFKWVAQRYSDVLRRLA